MIASAGIYLFVRSVIEMLSMTKLIKKMKSMKELHGGNGKGW